MLAQILIVPEASDVFYFQKKYFIYVFLIMKDFKHDKSTENNKAMYSLPRL